METKITIWIVEMTNSFLQYSGMLTERVVHICLQRSHPKLYVYIMLINKIMLSYIDRIY